MWLLLLACSTAEPGPAPAGTPAANAIADVRIASEQATDIATLAEQLTAMTDEARRRVASGESTQQEEIEQMRALLTIIEEKNELLQENLRQIERNAHEQAGDIGWPPEAIERR